MEQDLESMSDLQQALQYAIHQHLSGMLPQGKQLPVLQISPPERQDLGDLTLACHSLSKVFRKSPQSIATNLADALHTLSFVESALAIKGFLNIHFTTETFFFAILNPILNAPTTYGMGQQTNKTVMVEFSSPNTNKPQHLGHIRNNLLGSCVSNLLEMAGNKVIRANLINDRGIHICKSMVAYQRCGQGKTPSTEKVKGDHFVGNYYVQFEKAYKKEKQLLSPQLLAQGIASNDVPGEVDQRSQWLDAAKHMLRQWEAGDPETIELWHTMNDWVLKGFFQTYQRLGVHFDQIYRESETYQLGRETVLDAIDSGVVQRDADGSVFVDLEADSLGRKLLLRSDGTSLYMTQDIGTAQLKQTEYNLDRSIYVVGSEQDYHFQVLFLVLQKMGFSWAKECRHLSYGMVDLPYGKMKSREGQVVDADDIMDEVVQAVRQRMLDREQQLQHDETKDVCRVQNSELALQEIESISEIVGLGALKFFMLKYGAKKNFTFVPEKSISLQGDTGPYVQFAYTRIVGILRKAGKLDLLRQPTTQSPNFPELLGNSEERALTQLLGRFPDEVTHAAVSLNPAIICSYVLAVAQAFHRFVHEHSVLKAATPQLVQARLDLCLCTATVLRSGLGLLGIETPERM